MWSTKGPKPIMLPLPIHIQNLGQNPSPTVQLWRDSIGLKWFFNTLILILKGKRRWQMNHQKSSPSKTPTPQSHTLKSFFVIEDALDLLYHSEF
ncbi:hypothetical protein Peur_062196 [Populus x canadensis]